LPNSATPWPTTASTTTSGSNSTMPPMMVVFSGWIDKAMARRSGGCGTRA
jgi:hypothetical protein